jgi:hypothetical protein
LVWSLLSWWRGRGRARSNSQPCHTVIKACLDVSVAQVLEVRKFSGWKLLVANPALVLFSDLASKRVGARRLGSSLTLHS